MENGSLERPRYRITIQRTTLSVQLAHNKGTQGKAED